MQLKLKYLEVIKNIQTKEEAKKEEQKNKQGITSKVKG